MLVQYDHLQLGHRLYHVPEGPNLHTRYVSPTVNFPPKLVNLSRMPLTQQLGVLVAVL